MSNYIGTRKQVDEYIGSRLVVAGYQGSRKYFDAFNTISGAPPLTFDSRVQQVLRDYAVYGAAGGVGTATSGSEPTGYKITLSVISGEWLQDYNLYIGDSKLEAEEYVDYENQKVYKRTAQLFNYKTMSDGLQGYYLTASGSEAQSPEWSVTDYIPCYGSTFVLSKVGGNAPSICGYDAQKAFVDGKAYNTGGGSNKQNILVTFNSDVKFIRFSYYNVTSSPNYDDVTALMLIEDSIAPASYIPYIQPTDPPDSFPAITASQGNNTISSIDSPSAIIVTGRINV